MVLYILLMAAMSTGFFKKKLVLSHIILLLCVVCNLLFLVLGNEQSIRFNLFDNYQLFLKTTKFSSVFSLLISILYYASYSYGFYYMKQYPARQRDFHYSFLPISLISAYIISYSGNLLTLFIGYEFLTLSTYPLIIQNLTQKSLKAGKEYFLTMFLTSNIFLLSLLIILDCVVGNQNFGVRGVLTQNIGDQWIAMFFVCAVFGVAKTAIFPLYKWLVEAMVAPTPVSSLLHAVVVVKAGFFCLIKIMIYLYDIDVYKTKYQICYNLLIYLCCITIIFAAFKNLQEKILKRILAYSTISQISYMILIFSIGTKQALIMSFMYMINHSIAKIALFFAAGIIQLVCKQDNINNLLGVFKAIPVTVLIFIFSALSIMGIPPSFGYIVSGLVYKIIPSDITGVIIIITFVISSLAMCYYFFRLIYNFLYDAKNSSVSYIIRGNKIKLLNLVTMAVFLLNIPLIFYYPKIMSILSVDLN